LLCFYKHTISDSFYEQIGEKDITAHVNFSALSYWGALNGLTQTGFTDQGSFLNALGFREQLLRSLEKETDIQMAAQKACWLTQKMLVEMGGKFKVLVQQKGLELRCLTGLASYRKHNYSGQ
jgi:SAM-dependent MidA family methyltransferase